MALRSVNDIEKQILKADNMTREAESVSRYSYQTKLSKTIGIH